jgi:hypothetical protein
MTTKAIEAVLERVKAHSPHAADVREAEAALRELRAIRDACREAVTEKALEDWNTAQPSKLAAGIKVIQAIAREGA